jgi:PST family polysaccharide transporter
VFNAGLVSVAGKAVKGIAWNLGTGLGTRIYGMIGTLALTHFVAPKEYGEVSAASICVLTATMLTTFGFGQYIIAKRSPANVVFHVTVLHIGIAPIALAILLAFHGALGHMLHAPDIFRYMPGLAVAAFLERIQYVPERLLSRQLRFRTIALSRGVGEIAFTTVTLLVARKYGGIGVVYGNLARASLVALLMSISADRHEWLQPTRLRWEVVKDLFRYGVPIGVGGFAEFVSQRWDNLLASGMYGPELMGAYQLAYGLAETPTGAVADQIGVVLLPSFSQLAPEERKVALVRAASLMGLLVFPLAVGLGTIAPTVVRTFFPRAWIEVGAMLLVRSILSVVKPLTWTLVAYANAQQRPRIIMGMGIFKAVSLLVFVLVLGQFSIFWLCYAVGLAFATYFVVFLWTLSRSDGVPFVGYIARTLPPLAACVPMVVAVVGLRRLMLQSEYAQGKFMLIAEIVVGAVAYVIGALTIANHASRDFLNLLKNALRRRRA